MSRLLKILDYIVYSPLLSKIEKKVLDKVLPPAPKKEEPTKE
jgi:hypothetical protein